MEIREYGEYKENEIQRLYTEVGWTAYTENMPVLEQGYKNSLLVLAAYDTGVYFTGWNRADDRRIGRTYLLGKLSCHAYVFS